MLTKLSAVSAVTTKPEGSHLMGNQLLHFVARAETVLHLARAGL